MRKKQTEKKKRKEKKEKKRKEKKRKEKKRNEKKRKEKKRKKLNITLLIPCTIMIQIQHLSNQCTVLNVFTSQYLRYFYILVLHVSILQDHHQGLI
jgi:sRNA-binding protein